MTDFMILYVMLVATVVFLVWSKAIKEDSLAYAVLQISGWASGCWGIVFGGYTIATHYLGV